MTPGVLSAQQQMQLNQALALHQGGRLEQARDIYQQILRAQPLNADVLRLLGTAQSQLGNIEVGARYLGKSLEIMPNQPGAHYNYGNAMQSLGRAQDAVASYDRAVAFKPDFVDAWLSRGDALTDLERFDEAIASYDTALRLEPGFAEAHNNRGNALMGLERFADALASYDMAVRIEPGYAEAHSNRGLALQALNRDLDAVMGFERALAIQPGFHPARIQLAHACERLGRHEQAVAQWSRLAQAADIDTLQKMQALNAMARLLFDVLHEDEQAEAALRQVLEIDPTQREAAQYVINARQRRCAWPTVAPFGRVSRQDLLSGLSPLAACAYTDDPMLQLALNGRRNASDAAAAANHIVSHDPAELRRENKPLRVGYLSSDLRAHAGGHLLYEVFGLHDRSRVEVFIYYCGPRTSDPVHAHFKSQCDHFIDVAAMDDVTAARRIYDDGIQILVDVNGYTQYSRQRLLAMRPAPVIVNWLGFPGSMGSPHHHYIIADEWIIPPEHEIYFSEKVLRLPCYQPNNRQRVVAEAIPTRAASGLPDSAFVFCCFNGTQKITRHTYERWLTILKRTPDSVLWLLSVSESTQNRLKAYARDHGVDPSRIIFADWQANAEHLARYPLADLFLDTTPYGAHTTCSDALWMGVPVVTLSGRSFASRVCGSLLRSAGLAELVTTCAGDFVDLAVALAGDRPRLDACKARLKANRDTCVLFDTPGLVQHLEQLFAEMWQACLSNALPKPDLGNLETYLAIGLDHDHDAIEVQSIRDYQAFWRDRLARADSQRPIPRDNRLWR